MSSSLRSALQRLVRLPSRMPLAPSVVGVLAATFVVILSMLLISNRLGGGGQQLRAEEFVPGTVASRDVTADRDLVYVDEAATELKVEAVEKLTPPVFKVSEQITRAVLQRFAEFRAKFTAMVSEAQSLEELYLRVQLFFPGSMTREQLKRLDSHPVITEVFDDARRILEQVMEYGVVGLSAEQKRLLSAGGMIQLWRWKEGKLFREELPATSVITVDNVADRVRSMASSLDGVESDTAELIGQLVRSFVQENAFYDEQETRRAVERARLSVQPEIQKVVQGQIIVRRGDIVTEEQYARIKALGEYRVTVNANAVLGSLLLLLLFFALSLFLLSERQVGSRLSLKQVVLFAVEAVLFATAGLLVYRFMPNGHNLPVGLFLPMAAFAGLIALLVSVDAGVVFSLCASSLLLILLRMEADSFLFSLLSGVAGVAVLSTAQTRIDLVKAGVYLSLLNLPVVWAIGFMRNGSSSWFAWASSAAVGNGFFAGILALGFLPLLEHLLNSATRFRLMELSDLNAPILKRMLTLAPGTYSHSINVANLAESACVEIGANYLLARTGAYYHDIGKLDQPEYFIENQTGGNKHDDLNPSLSVAVIKSHVKSGVERARALGLPPEVIDIIAQHHGRDVIKYFYQRAMDKQGGKGISAADYSYQGVRPQSREAAVVMLADAVEASTRTLRRPTMGKLERSVWSIIMDRFNSGELGECALTTRDLESIKNSFVQILAGYFHTRIEYPKGAVKSE